MPKYNVNLVIDDNGSDAKILSSEITRVQSTESAMSSSASSVNTTVSSNLEDHSQLIRLVKHFESFYSKAYLDPVGIPTIGYGTIQYSNGNKVKLGDTITEDDAINEMMLELNQKFKAIKDSIKVPLNTNQWDALLSFAYNVGEGALKNSTLLKKVNEGNFDEVPSQFMRWINAGGRPLAGLWRRRLAEALLFQGKLYKIPESSKIPTDYASIKYFPEEYNQYV